MKLLVYSGLHLDLSPQAQLDPVRAMGILV